MVFDYIPSAGVQSTISSYEISETPYVLFYEAELNFLNFSPVSWLAELIFTDEAKNLATLCKIVDYKNRENNISTKFKRNESSSISELSDFKFIYELDFPPIGLFNEEGTKSYTELGRKAKEKIQDALSNIKCGLAMK